MTTLVFPSAVFFSVGMLAAGLLRMGLSNTLNCFVPARGISGLLRGWLFPFCVALGGSKRFQHLEDTLFRSNDATTVYQVTAMLWYYMKHR